MKEIEASKAKKFGYFVGYTLGVVLVACIIALAIGGTLFVLSKMF